MSDALYQLALRHVEAFRDGKVDVLIADYADDARLVTSMGTIEGKAAIEEMFATNLASDFFSPATSETTFEPPVVVNEEVVIVYWATVNATHRIAGGSDTLVVKNGKIIAHMASGEAIELSVA